MRVSSPDGRIVVLNGNWGDTTLGAIVDVLESAYRIMTEAVGAEPEAPIHVSHWTQNPLTVSGRRPYEVLLSARSRYWSQYVFQFGYALCRILTHHDRYAGRRHRWFEGSIGQLASLFTLHEVASRWRDDPPPRVPGARDFAPRHGTYLDRLRGQIRESNPSGLPDWFRENRSALESDGQRHPREAVIAEGLLDSFLDEPRLWREVALLNEWDPGQDDDFAAYLESWKRCAASAGRPGRAAAVVERVLGLGSPEATNRNPTGRSGRAPSGAGGATGGPPR